MMMKLKMHGAASQVTLPAGARQPVTGSSSRPIGRLETTPLVFIGVGGSLAV